MQGSKRIAVIGAGIIGVQVALRLQGDGHTVLLLDPDPPGDGCSFGNGGYIATEEVLPLASPGLLARVPAMLLNPKAPFTVRWQSIPGLLPWFLRFARACRPTQVARGIQVMNNLMKATPKAWSAVLEATNLQHLRLSNGFMRVFETNKGFEHFSAELEVQKNHGVPFEVLSPARAMAKVPALSNRIRQGIFYPEGSHLIDPHLAVCDLAASFVARGGEFRQLPLSGFEWLENRVGAVLLPTSREEVDAVVVAAGIHSREILKWARFRLPLAAERGYHVMMEGHVPELELPIVPVERGVIITPMRDGTRFAGTVEFGSPKAPPSRRRADILLKAGREIFPNCKIREKSRWMGNRPTLPDYLPAIGVLSHVPNLFVATGHQHLGVTLAAVTAEIIAGMIRGEQDERWTALSPERFG
ncbi:MAG: FAD-dependent oxidoreductase [Sphingomonadales bacterium]